MNNSSNVSLSSSQQHITKRQISVYDQMVPVIADEGANFFSDPSSDNANINNVQNKPSVIELKNNARQSSNENLIRNLQNQDFGSYPRRASSSNLNGNISNTSFHTRDSSITSVNKADALEDVFATPKSGAPSQLPSTFDRNNEDSDDRRSGDDDQGSHNGQR